MTSCRVSRSISSMRAISKAAALPDRLGGRLGDHAELRLGVAGVGLDLEPDESPARRMAIGHDAPGENAQLVAIEANADDRKAPGNAGKTQDLTGSGSISGKVAPRGRQVCDAADLLRRRADMLRGHPRPGQEIRASQARCIDQPSRPDRPAAGVQRIARKPAYHGIGHELGAALARPLLQAGDQVAHIHLEAAVLAYHQPSRAPAGDQVEGAVFAAQLVAGRQGDARSLERVGRDPIDPARSGRLQRAALDTNDCQAALGAKPRRSRASGSSSNDDNIGSTHPHDCFISRNTASHGCALHRQR